MNFRIVHKSIAQPCVIAEFKWEIDARISIQAIRDAYPNYNFALEKI